MKAIWNGQVIADSADTLILEGNHYFPPDSVRQAFLRPSEKTTYCPWKGTANYYSLHVHGADNADAAWYYAEPKEAASEIAGRVAFWNGVEIVE